MTSGKRADTHNVNVVLNSLACSLGGSLEQRSHIHVKSAVGITCCHYLCTTVVTVLTHLGNEDTWTTSFLLCELLSELASQIEVAVVLTF